MIRHSIKLFFFSLAACLSASAPAQTVNWIGGTSGEFDDASNWLELATLDARVPTGVDLAVHTGEGNDIVIDNDFTVDSFRISGSDAGAAIVTQNSGVVTINATTNPPDLLPDLGLIVGEFGPNTSTYNLNGGSIVIDDGQLGPGNISFDIGAQTGAAGVFNMTAGTVVNNSTSPEEGFFLGRALGTSGTVNLFGGTLNGPAGVTQIGLDGSADWNQTGGTFNAGAVQVGRFQSPSATVDLSGSADWNVTGALLLSDGATGLATDNSTLTITGSNVDLDVGGLFVRDQATLSFVADAGGVSPIVQTATGGFELLPQAGNSGFPSLNVDLSAFSNNTDPVTLIDGFQASIGMFDGLPEGTLVPNAGGRFITYQGGDGFDVQLVFNTPPTPVNDGVIARWGMVANPNAPGPFAEGNPATLDSRTAPGEGVLIGNAGVTAPDDSLFFFSGDLGQQFMTSTDTPPVSMFTPGNEPLAGAADTSYNAGALTPTAGEGGLFFPQDVYGDEFSFEDSFSIEMFFKTDGTDTGVQQLILGGEIFPRFGLTLNEGEGEVGEGGVGALRFFVNDGSTLEFIDIGGDTGIGLESYADDEWHYILATFEELDGSGLDAITLSVANEDGSFDSVTSLVSLSLPSGADGNVFIGVEDFLLSTDGDPRRFQGLIDEVQLTAGIVSATDQLGLLGAAGVPGDTDGDGDVDLADLDTLATNFGQTPPLAGGASIGDFDMDGDVDLGDLDTLATNFGTGTATAVPEPSALLLLGVGLLTSGSRQRGER